MAKLTLITSTENNVVVIKTPQRTWVAISFHRQSLEAARNRPEFNKRGVYILLGYDSENNREKIYIGKGSVVGSRLNSHNSTKDFWSKCIFFGDGEEDFIGEDHIAHLESQLINRALLSNFSVINEAVPKIVVPLHAREAMNELLQFILNTLPVMGAFGFGMSETASIKIQDKIEDSPKVEIPTSEVQSEIHLPYFAKKNTQAERIESAICTTPKSIRQIADESGLPEDRVRQHVKHPRVSPWISKTDTGDFYFRKPAN